MGFGFDFCVVLVTPEKEAPTLAARPRALLAAPATAAIGDVDVTEPAPGLASAGGEKAGGWLVPACQAGAGASNV